MRIREGYILRNVMGETMLLPVSPNDTYKGIIILNETGRDILYAALACMNAEEISKELCELYETDQETVLRDVQVFIKKLYDEGVLVL